MRIVSLLLMFFHFFLFGKSQESRNKAFFVGIGSHEAVHAGFKYSFKPRSSLCLSYGNFFNFIHKERYWDITLEYERIFKNKNKPDKLSPWSISPKLIYWRLNDSYYYFKVLSTELAIGYRLQFGDRQGLKFDFGPTFMVVLDYRRLTFLEAGWPKKFMVNGSVKYYILF